MADSSRGRPDPGTNETSNPIRVRSARADDPADREFLKTVTPRLEAGMPDWIAPGVLAGIVERSVLAGWTAQRENETILIAESASGEPLGFLYLEWLDDRLADQRTGHVREFAVLPEAEGQGAGRALMNAAELWARDQGAVAMRLEVWANNERARAVYAHLGYEVSELNLRKPLTDPV